MAGNKKPRKRYKPKPVLANPLAFAIEGAIPIHGDHLDEVHQREWDSWESLKSGKGTLKDWQTIVDCNNIAQTMAGMGIGKLEVMPVCHEVEQEMLEAAARFQRTKRMGLTGLGIQQIKDLLEYHHLQRTAVARRVYEEAIRLTVARIKNGHCTIDLNQTLEMQP